MRKITKQAAEAFANHRIMTNSNTHVRPESDGVTRCYLHGNLIAEHHAASGEVRMTLAGWGTPTTRERVNGLAERLGLGRPFYQANHEQHFNGEPISASDWVTLRNGFGKPNCVTCGGAIRGAAFMRDRDQCCSPECVTRLGEIEAELTAMDEARS